MAYYPPELVERIALIKRLQEERFMPLRMIKVVLEEDPEHVRALVELEDRILERALAGAEEGGRTSAKEVRERYEIPRNVLERLAEIGVLTPEQAGLRAGRREDHRGDRELPRGRLRGGARLHGVRHAALPRGAGAARARRRSARCSTAWRARSRSSAPWRSSRPASEPLRELIGAMHSKLLLAELRKQRKP